MLEHTICIQIFTWGLIRTDLFRSPQFARLFGATSILRFYIRSVGADRLPVAPIARIRQPYANTIQPRTLAQCVTIKTQNLVKIEQVEMGLSTGGWARRPTACRGS
jgi:hypothetical protein